MTHCAARRLTGRFRFLVHSLGRRVRDRKPRLECLESRALLSGATGVWNFATAQWLQPPRLSVLTDQPGTAPGLIFTAPEAGPGAVGQSGTLITDNAGNPVWFHPLKNQKQSQAFDFEAQTLFGQPVLTWWQGRTAGGIRPNLPGPTPLRGSRFVIVNDHYQPVMTVSARNGFIADPHEFLITPQGTAIFIATKVVRANLTPDGGVRGGAFVDPEIQEVNLRNGKLVFAWNMATHVPLSDSLIPAPNTRRRAWNVFHMNSVELSADGTQLLVSARCTSTIYDISHQTGQILWEMGGKQNEFHFPSSLVSGPFGSIFQYQHDARFVPGGISLFDDAGRLPGPYGGPFGPGRGLILKVNSNNLTVSLQKPIYSHDPQLYPNSQGNLQTLPNGDVFIGWGEDVQPGIGARSYYSEYSPSGTLLYDAVLPGPDVTYRAFRFPWVGLPLTRPSAAVVRGSGQPTVYASWNGSTATVAWELLAGATPRTLSPVTTAPRTGFETALPSPTVGPFFQVRAIGAGGAVLNSSAVIRGRKSPHPS